jgi:SAM-dependent methyltransferase
MAHREQQDFISSVKDRFPEKFKGVRVLDIGSLDINGNNRFAFEDYEYIGIDIGEGNNVDVICRGHEFKDGKGFDVVISTECFEHDEFWNLTIQNATNLTKSNGVFLFSCATTGRPEHGTRRTSPQDSPFTSQIENDYYMNLTEEDVRTAIDVDKYFSEYYFFARDVHPNDLYFWGIKK